MTFHQQPVPCPPPWYQPASQCFDQVKQFEEMLQTMVDKTVTDKLNTVIQQGALPPGVVDGSDASPGQVGEFISGTATVNFAAYPATTIVHVSPLVVPAGDWDLWASMAPTVRFGGSDLFLDPLPAGMSNNMGGNLTIGTEAVLIVAMPARGNFTMPTLLSWRVDVYQGTDPSLTAGTALFRVEGRRRR